MSSSSINALRELARQDEALRTAIDGAQQVEEVQRIAASRGIELSAEEALLWLDEQDRAANLDADMLDSLSQGLVPPDGSELNDEQLAGIVGGEAFMSAGEALIGYSNVGEAGYQGPA
jgi:hypothetical protein